MRKGLIIFIRNPVIGQVKTRLAKTVGDEKALQVYELMLAHTHDNCCKLSCDKFVYYSDQPPKNDLWENDLFIKRMQTTGNLGEKMARAFKDLFDEGYKQLIIIGSDCLELTSGILEDAFGSLGQSDVVIGPSTDGGYYLLGMNRLIPELFINKQWSSSSVMEDTLADLAVLNISYTQLIPLTDIDEEKDLPEFLR